MPLAIAILHDPVGIYLFMIVATAGLAYGAHARRFVPAFAGGSAAALATLGSLSMPPSAGGLALLAAAIVLLHAEFLLATRGTAAVLGVATALAGAWLVLAPTPPLVRIPLAVGGALALLYAVGAGLRVATLRSP